jgi:hypothetical protein
VGKSPPPRADMSRRISPSAPNTPSKRVGFQKTSTFFIQRFTSESFPNKSRVPSFTHFLPCQTKSACTTPRPMSRNFPTLVCLRVSVLNVFFTFTLQFSTLSYSRLYTT